MADLMPAPGLLDAGGCVFVFEPAPPRRAGFGREKGFETVLIGWAFCVVGNVWRGISEDGQ